MSQDYLDESRSETQSHSRQHSTEPRSTRSNSARDDRRAAERAANAVDFDEREILFIEAFCTVSQYDPKKAAQTAGYSNAQYGYEVYKRPQIKRAILERMRHEKITAAEIVNRLGVIFRNDFNKFHKVEEYEEEVSAKDASGNAILVTVTKKRLVQDFVSAFENDETYSIRDVEYYRTGEVKRVTHEPKLEAIKLLGAVFGLFGTKDANDDWGRSWLDRSQSKGYTIDMVLAEMKQMLLEQGKNIPPNLIEGIFTETGQTLSDEPEPVESVDADEE